MALCVMQVLKFAIDAVKAEAFNPKTLFLFGSYTIGARGMPLRDACARGGYSSAVGMPPCSPSLLAWRCLLPRRCLGSVLCCAPCPC